MSDQNEYEVILTPQAEGGFTVSVPDLPDVVTEGETREDALAMAKDAIEGYLTTMRDHGWPVPAIGTLAGTLRSTGLTRDQARIVITRRPAS